MTNVCTGIETVHARYVRNMMRERAIYVWCTCFS